MIARPAPLRTPVAAGALALAVWALAACMGSGTARTDSAAADTTADTTAGGVPPFASADTVAQIPAPGAAGADTAWVSLQAGATGGATAGFALAADGTMSYRGRALSPALPMRTADGSNAAVAWRVSPPSPNGRWALATGEEPTFGRVHVLDLERGTTKESPATKYGITPWVAWSPTLPHALVSNRVEGTALLYRIALENGEASQVEFGRAVKSPLSATPDERSLRWLNPEGSAFRIDARVACNDAVERCEGAPAAETRRFHVDLRTLEVSEVAVEGARSR